MKSYFLRIILVGFVTTIAIISWLGYTSYRNNKLSDSAAQWVIHANNAKYHSEEVLALVLDLEAGQRGYALTGMEEFLEPAYRASKQLPEHIEELRSLTRDNSAQQERLTRLEQLLDDKIAFTMDAISQRRNQNTQAAIDLVSTLNGKRLTDEIREVIRLIQDEENQLLDERTVTIEKRVNRFNAYFLGMVLTIGVILILLFYFIYVNLKARTEAEDSLRFASARIQDVYNNAPCGYHSLDEQGIIVEMNNTWLEWLRYSREEVVNRITFEQLMHPDFVHKFKTTFARFKEQGVIRDEEFVVVRKDGTSFPVLLNEIAIFDEHKNFIKSRSTVMDYTEQKKALERIEQLNHDLESFSYSVSHDLRAPLRSIDGYTQILLEDYASKLDDEGRRVLHVVVNNARRMARLIDDLLDFSRIGRKEIERSLIETDSLVNSVISELVALEQGRQLDIRIGKLENCYGDPNLLRQVWVNLISNALKYTRNKDIAVIEITSESRPEEVVFNVRDNGTGFDMQYANKLFGVFQRLHRQKDFEGTGVGLAIVHRIVTRHGGSVSGQGETGAGAAFSFTLPRPGT